MRASRIMWRGLAILAALTVLGIAYLIYVGETTLWATDETKAGSPTLEIRP